MQCGLDGGDADLAVALDAMTVAAGKQRARDEHRQIEFGARDQLLVVQIAAHRARDQRGDAAPSRRRRHAHDAEKRLQRQVEPPRQPAHHPLPVERDVDQAGLMEIVGQGAGQRPDQIIAPVLPQPDIENFDLQNVARLGASTATGPVRMCPGTIRSFLA